MGVQRQITRRAQVQHGLVSRRQTTDFGATDDMIAGWMQSGWLERVNAGVYRVGGAPRTWEQSVTGAVLAVDGIASHRTAARIWGIADHDDIEVTVPRNRRGRAAGATVHRSRDVLTPNHTTRRSGIPVTTPMRTLVDLGAVTNKFVVADALELAVIAKACSVVAVERALDDVARKGRRGAGVIREVLDDRALGRDRGDGLLEARMARILREHGVRRPKFQYEIRLHGKLLARVDFAYPDDRVAIEVDGFDVHSTPTALQADLERQNRLVAAGWTVLRFTWLDIVRRPEWVVQQIRSVLLSRAA